MVCRKEWRGRHVVLNTRRIAVIDKASRNSRRYSGALAQLPQQDAAGVTTDMTAVESAGQWSKGGQDRPSLRRPRISHMDERLVMPSLSMALALVRSDA